MPLRSPNLDDRTFQQLLDEAKSYLQTHCPSWTDLTAGDPGIVLLEVFAYLTEVMIYRLNRIPEKAYIELLNLLGLKLQPPVAAGVRVVFTRSRVSPEPLEIPERTRITTARPADGNTSPVFMTVEKATIKAGETTAEALAYHADFIEAELLGVGTGRPRLSFTTARHPIVARNDKLRLRVGVEIPREELAPHIHTVEFRGKAYRIWDEVENFTDVHSGLLPFVADRIAGTITFAPALRTTVKDEKTGVVEIKDVESEERVRVEGRSPLEETEKPLGPVPGDKREIRCWYWCGGGPEGNVLPGTLTVLKDPIAGVTVTNPERALGGLSAETLENAMVRGPLEFHSVRRCVTASDFELRATATGRSSGAVEIAKAITKYEIWKHATPGTVEVLLVPKVPQPPPPDKPLTAEILQGFQSDRALDEIRSVLDERRPLGTVCEVNWARYKSVQVIAKIVVFPEQDPELARARVLRHLYAQIKPTKWEFGEALRSSHIYQLVLREAGISYIERVRLQVDDAPDQNVACLTRDTFQPNTWFVGRADTVFRSTNDGDGWEAIKRFPDQEVRIIATHREIAGWVAVATRLPDSHFQLYLSNDCGESWTANNVVAFDIEGMTWIRRENQPVLLLATSVGLYEYTPGPGAVPVQIEVDPDAANLGFWAVQVFNDVSGVLLVALAAQKRRGVYLSSDFRRSGTQASKFVKVGLENEDARVLAVQQVGPRSFLWAGFASTGDDPGKGAARVEILEAKVSVDGWQFFSQGWQGRTCWSLAFRGMKGFAASQRSGVVVLNLGKEPPVWEEPEKTSGLPPDPVQDRLFLRVSAVRIAPETGLLLCSGAKGVFRSRDEGKTYEMCSSREFTDKVTLPGTWLFCSREHQIDVVRENEAPGN